MSSVVMVGSGNDPTVRKAFSPRNLTLHHAFGETRAVAVLSQSHDCRITGNSETTDCHLHVVAKVLAISGSKKSIIRLVKERSGSLQHALETLSLAASVTSLLILAILGVVVAGHP